MSKPMSNTAKAVATAPARILTTDAELEAAARTALEREKTATKIVPRAKIAGFAKADPAMLADVAIDPSAESLWSDTVDDGVLLEQLIEIAVGARAIVELSGVIRGRVRSEARAVSARQNGRKGGRPRKTPTSG